MSAAPIKAVHLVDEGVYLVEEGHYGRTLEAAGLAVRPPFVVEDLTGVVEVSQRSGLLLRWEDDAGASITPAEYQDKRQTLLASSTGYGDDGDPLFASLEDEFAFRKFSQRWKSIFAPATVERLPVEFTVSEVRVRTGDPDIVSLWNSPDVHSDRRLYSMSRVAVAVKRLRQVCAELGLVLEVPNHSGIRFAKIDGQYSFNDDANFEGRAFVGTLQQCQDEKARIHAIVDSPVGAHAARVRGLPLNNAGEVLLRLRDTEQALLRVRAKSESGGALMAARKLVGDLIRQVDADVSAARGQS